MPSKMDKIFGPIEAQIGGKKSKIGYYDDLNLAEGEQKDFKNKDNNIGAGIGYDSQDKKSFLYVEGRRGPISAGVETKSIDEYSGNINYDVNENTKVGVTANKDDFGKSVNIGITSKFNHGGSIIARGNKIAKSKPTKLY